MRFAALFLLTLPLLANAQLEAFVDPRKVDEMETLRLTLRIDGQRETPQPDLSPLETDFEILGTNTSSQYRSINGQVRSWVEYQIRLRPKRSGTLTIPPLTLGQFTSDALTVEVTALDPSIKRAVEQMVFFESELSPDPVYVQSQLTLTRRLFYSTSSGVQMYSDLPGAPQLPDAVVLDLGDTKSYTEERGGLTYGVLEQRFAIVPERSGELVIPPVSITSSIRLLKQGRMRRSGIRVRSEELRVQVQPIPAAYPASAPWLAAQDVQLIELWQPDPPTFTVGEPVTRRVVARVSGNVASALPPFQTDLDAQLFRTYPEAPELRDSTDANTLTGTRSERFTLLPSAPGHAEVPPLQITWWDTVNNRVRTTTLAGRHVLIGGELPAGSSVPEPAAEPIAAAPELAPVATPAPTSSALPLWLGALLIVLAGALLYRNRARALHTLVNLLQRFENPQRIAYQQLEKTLAQVQNPAQQYDALVRYGTQCAAGSRSAGIALLEQHDTTRGVLERLRRKRFGPKPGRVPLPGEEILQAAAALQANEPAQAAKDVKLPDLYPA